MKIIVHRGTHQIGGIAAEIRTERTRILIDMGDELSLDPDVVSAPLCIPGVTDSNGNCEAVLFTHYHGDHVGQMKRIREDIPLYAGALAKDIMLMCAEHGYHKDAELCKRIRAVQTFEPGVPFAIGDFRITPYSVDHSACDSYMFLIEAEGTRLLYTGDFRAHGFRGKALPKILDNLVGKVDALVIEGTTLSRPDEKPMTESELQRKVKAYLEQHKYVFVLCASTNLERICALSKAVPKGKYFLCDRYQSDLLDLIQQHWGGYSPLYRDIKKTVYGENLLPKLRDRGFLMTVRDNRRFREIVSRFDAEQSILLYSMWDGYRTKPNSTIPEFLNLFGRWAPLHTSGHASHRDLQMVAERVHPHVIIPIHSDHPEILQTICPEATVALLKDGEEFVL